MNQAQFAVRDCINISPYYKQVRCGKLHQNCVGLKCKNYESKYIALNISCDGDSSVGIQGSNADVLIDIYLMITMVLVFVVLLEINLLNSIKNYGLIKILVQYLKMSVLVVAN
jgi:hypothetical protein